MQERLEQLLGKEESPETLYLTHEWPWLNHDGIQMLEEFLDEHPHTQLVVFDTLARVRPPMKSSANPYYEDYKTIAPLKAVADRYKLAIVLVHHFRKAEGADPFDAVSGSSGLTAAADDRLACPHRPHDQRARTRPPVQRPGHVVAAG